MAKKPHQANPFPSPDPDAPESTAPSTESRADAVASMGDTYAVIIPPRNSVPEDALILGDGANFEEVTTANNLTIKTMGSPAIKELPPEGP